MKELRFTLVADGPSDAALITILAWMLQVNGVSYPLLPCWADFRSLRTPPKKLAERIEQALYAYPCELLFVHRDAENQTPASRRDEIDKAISALRERTVKVPPHVVVIPIRMTEAWLLFDETALRLAAGNPNGRVGLSLPKLKGLEAEPSPKQILNDLLELASELTGRRLKAFKTRVLARLVVNHLDDSSPLRELRAVFTGIAHEKRFSG